MSSKIMTERIYMAIGGHGWGKGLSIDKSKRQARTHAKRGVRLDVYRLPRGAHSVYVSELGDLRWQFQDGADTGAQAELVQRNGRTVQRATATEQAS